MSGVRIGVDIGGTFTDFTLLDESGTIKSWKEDSDKVDPVHAIMTGLSAVARNEGRSLRELLGDTEQFVHGSTIATNALIERDGARVALICTEGFRDVLYLRDGYKPNRFDVSWDHPGTFVDRSLCLGVRERIDRDGNVLVALDEDAVRRFAERLRAERVEAVAVALLWSSASDRHELRVRSILEEELPDIPIVHSADVLPEIGEWHRTSATVLSSYVQPAVSTYLARLKDALAREGLRRPPLIMQINGGCSSVEEVIRRPVFTLASGPAAAPAAASYYARELGHDDVITIDMGGTSLDVCVIHRGRPTMAKSEVEQQPIGVSGVEVLSVGAGGGSIGWIDEGGALRVGPESAGSRPGPACYAAGGRRPTVTDANVALGYIDPGAFLGGRRLLRRDLAEQAIEEHVAGPLGVDVQHAAAGMLEIVNANMAGAIRTVSVERGIDPRDFVLLAGGGAGGLHATALARMVGMRKVIVPAQAGTLCAFGMSVTDVRQDYLRALHTTSATVDPADLTALFKELEDEARARASAQGFGPADVVFERAVDARYPGQVHELTVPVERDGQYDAAAVRAIEELFHAEHERRFSYAMRGKPLEFLHWRLSAYGKTGLRQQAKQRGSQTFAAPTTERSLLGEREVTFAKSGPTVVQVHDTERMAPGSHVRGPAVVQAPDTTVLLQPGDELVMDAARSLVIDVSG